MNEAFEHYSTDQLSFDLPSVTVLIRRAKVREILFAVMAFVAVLITMV